MGMPDTKQRGAFETPQQQLADDTEIYATEASTQALVSYFLQPYPSAFSVLEFDDHSFVSFLFPRIVDLFAIKPKLQTVENKLVDCHCCFASVIPVVSDSEATLVYASPPTAEND
jgi:hypothetical protein